MHTNNQQSFTWSAAAYLAAWLAFGALPAVAAGMYKWTDDQGIVHYSDQMPADAVNKGGTVFDKQGRPIKKIDPAMTPSQARAKEAEDERQRLIARALEDKSRRDTALMQTYTSEEEIDFARNRALLAVESQVKSAETYIANLTKRKEDLKGKKVAYGTKPLPATVINEMSGIDDELARQDKVLAQRRTEIAAISAKYEGDRQRWREIRDEQLKSRGAAVSNTPPAPSNKGATSSVTK